LRFEKLLTFAQENEPPGESKTENEIYFCRPLIAQGISFAQRFRGDH